MRYLILSDIHANYEAFAAVMNSTRRKRWDKAICLGDIVGYAAEVNQTVDRLRRIKPLVAIRGNHDKVVSGKGEVAPGASVPGATRTCFKHNRGSS